MRFKIFLLALFMFVCMCGQCDAQCTTQPGYVCITQETADKVATVADKLKAANNAITALQAEVAALQTAVKDRDALIAQHVSLDGINDQIHAKEAQLRETLQAMLKLDDDVIERLKKQLNGGKTKMQRFLDILKVAYYVLSAGAVVVGL